MLIIAVALIGAVAIAGFIAFTLLCLGIRCEDKAATLSGPAPGFAAVQARRFTGWHAQPSTRVAGDTAKAGARADA